MIPDTPTLIRAGRFVQRAESAEFLADPGGLDLSDLGYGPATPLYWREPDGKRLPAILVAQDQVDGGIDIACRGTEKIWEWLDDARFAQHQCRWAPAGCLVENGFSDLYDSTTLWDGSDFRSILGNPATRRVYGHSLGSAWAAQCAGDNRAALCIAFAMPKLGNAALAAYVESRVGLVYRPVNSHDIVPLMPWSLDVILAKLEYLNPGVELPLNSGGQIAHGPGCAHHLTTYLHLLDATIPVDTDCIAT